MNTITWKSSYRYSDTCIQLLYNPGYDKQESPLRHFNVLYTRSALTSLEIQHLFLHFLKHKHFFRCSSVQLWNSDSVDVQSNRLQARTRMQHNRLYNSLRVHMRQLTFTIPRELHNRKENTAPHTLAHTTVNSTTGSMSSLNAISCKKEPTR